jgi:predicted metal-binding membrane protein
MIEQGDNNASLIRSLPWRDRLAILAVIGVATVLSWVYLVDMAIDMDSMVRSDSMQEMGSGGDMAMDGGMMMMQDWTMKYFVAMLLMWTIMMIGMMVPTAAPMALIYAAIARKAAAQGTPLAPTATFVSGYVVMWIVFSLFATLAQWGLDEAALLSPMMVSSSPAFGAVLLIGAGIYQMTPMKDACLQHCRSPAHFISKSWQPGAIGAFRMGLKHGAYCLGCCWILMGLLFFGGVMSLLWIAGITLFVFLEKVIPFGKLGGKIAGGGLVAWGLVGLGLWHLAS